MIAALRYDGLLHSLALHYFFAFATTPISLSRQCEACNYVLHMLIDRLGDQFSRVTVEAEAELLCPRIQWGACCCERDHRSVVQSQWSTLFERCRTRFFSLAVFKSACDFIARKNKAVVADLIMKVR